MSQLLLQGFPDGAIKIGTFLSILEKDGIRTSYVYFFWSWVIQYPLGFSQDENGDAYAFWAKIKFTGPAFPHASPDEPNAIYIERVALEKADSRATPADERP
ncbi:MAG: hypothetical protein PF904_15720 [Kiritimatiellae bacterium]|nr:hypothetical protein [Kiritimatiellia bacterium]